MITYSAFIRECMSSLRRWRRFSWLPFRSDPFNQLWKPNSPSTKTRAIYKDLVGNGFVVWGAVVQANAALFSPGQDDLPAGFAFSPSDYFDNHPHHLVAIATRVFRLKGRTFEEPHINAVAELVTDETYFTYCDPLPYDLTDGHDVLLCTVKVRRACLPSGILDTRLLPLLVHPPENGASITLPPEFWPCDGLGVLEADSESERWETRSRTSLAPRPTSPGIGGRPKATPRITGTNARVVLSSAAAEVLRGYLREGGPATDVTAVLRPADGSFRFSIEPRGHSSDLSSTVFDDIMVSYPEPVCGPDEHVVVDYADDAFGSGFRVFREPVRKA